MTVRLRGSLPAEEMNGLARIEEALNKDPKAKRLVVGVVDVYRRQDHGDGVFEPTIEVVQMEVLDGRLRDRGVKLLTAAYNRRTGARQLAGFGEEIEDEEGNVAPPPATVPPIPGPRFLFEPGPAGKWSLVYRDVDDELLSRKGGLAPRADVTLAVRMTLDEIDALDDVDLSTLARMLVTDGDRFEDASPVGGAEQDAAPLDEETLDENDDAAAEDAAVEKETQDA